ncbi:MAG: FtsX-like permease family protein, partial [Sphingomonadales bacterium]|nr:FtsX-like permease family protein [Sphingomonadales bacterium]
AVFLLHIVLSRLIITQRGEIAVLKAFGYTNIEVGLHYLMFAIVATIIGTALGTAGGIVLGGSYMEIYGQYFEFPNLDYQVSPPLLIGSAIICMLGAFTGALSAVRKAVELPPAEAMRPEAPARYRQGILERAGLGARIPATGRMIVRNLERKPMTAFMSSLGVAMAVAMLTTWLFIFDGFIYMMDLQFRHIQREDLTLGFAEITDDRVHYDLANMQGVNKVETFRIVPVRFRYGHRKEELAIQGIELDSELRRIIDASANEISVPREGVVISDVLARRLRVGTGDTLLVEMLEGRRLKTELPVSGIVEDFLGINAHMNRAALDRLTGDKGAVSGAFLAVEPAHAESLSYELKQAPRIASVTSPDAMLDSFEEQLEESILVAVVFLLGFAGVIAVGVVYNGARISLSERGRELTSLRVMGFHRYEVTALLLGEQALITALAIPVGWMVGYGLGTMVSAALETDLYRIPFVILPRSYLMSALVVIVAAIVSGFLVKRRLDKMNIVDVLKTRE